MEEEKLEYLTLAQKLKELHSNEGKYTEPRNVESVQPKPVVDKIY